MFDLKQPCNDCPFRLGQGENFRLHEDRVINILESDTWFQCHKTVEYDDEGEAIPGVAGAQHCYGAMAIRMAEDNPNQMMRIAGRLGQVDLDSISTEHTYTCLDEVFDAHRGRD